MQEPLPVEESTRKASWSFRLALLSSGLAGLLGLIVGGQQFLLKFLYDQSAHTRTIWGMLFMLLGVLGPVLPVLLVSKRRSFARLGKGKQWAAVVAIPVVYGAALVLCGVASARTKTLIMDRLGLTLLVRHESANPNRPTSVEMHGLGRELPSGFGDWNSDDGQSRRFRFEGFQPYLRHHQEVTISAVGATRVQRDGAVEITLDFDADESFRLQVEGLAGVQIARDGEGVSQGGKFTPGKFAVVITGRPK